MILPTRGHYLCELLSRTRQLSSGLWLAEKLKEDKKDNVCRCMGAGDPGIKSCYSCHDKKLCKTKKCKDQGKIMPIIACRGDLVHYKIGFGQKIRYEGKNLIILTNSDIIAIEREGVIQAVGSMVVIKLHYAETMHNIIVPDNAKQNSGDFWGEVVSVGPNFPDKSVKPGDKITYFRGDGYKFRSYGADDGAEYLAVKEKWCYGKEEKIN